MDSPTFIQQYLERINVERVELKREPPKTWEDLEHMAMHDPLAQRITHAVLIGGQSKETVLLHVVIWLLEEREKAQAAELQRLRTSLPSPWIAPRDSQSESHG